MPWTVKDTHDICTSVIACLFWEENFKEFSSVIKNYIVMLCGTKRRSRFLWR